jgi:hypothetical protein
MILLTEERYRNRIREIKEIVYCVDPIKASEAYWKEYKWAVAKKQAKKGYFEKSVEIPSICGIDRWITIKFSDYEEKEPYEEKKTKDGYRVIRKFFLEFGFDMLSLARKLKGVMEKYIKKLNREVEDNELFNDILDNSGVLKTRYIVNFDIYFVVWISKDKNLVLDHAILLGRKDGVFDYGNVKFSRGDIPQWDDHWEMLVNEYIRNNIDTLLLWASEIVEKEYSLSDDRAIGNAAINLLNSVAEDVYTARLFFWSVSDHLFYYSFQWTMEFLIDLLKKRGWKEEKSALGVEWLWGDTKP